MNPKARELQDSLFGACRHVPGFLQSHLKGLTKSDRQKAKKSIRIFGLVLRSQTVFCDPSATNSKVKIELLDALRDSAVIAKQARNSRLETMLKSTHCFATVISLTMHLNDCIAQGEDSAEELGRQFSHFVSQIPGARPNLNQLGAETTASLVEFFEKKVDDYSKGIADHMLSAYSDR